MSRFIWLWLFWFPAQLFATTPDSVTTIPNYDILKKLSQNDTTKGEVTIHCDSTISNLLKWHIKLNEKKRSFSGYRIQILSVNSYGGDVEELKKYVIHLKRRFKTYQLIYNMLTRNLKSEWAITIPD